MSAPGKQPTVSLSAVVAAGLASATAALMTSRFGVAGTIIGAALTTMIITGGSAILKAYLESVSGKVRRVPGKVRERASRSRASDREPGRGPEMPSGPNPPGRPDLLNNSMGRLRAALNWFSNLSLPRKRYILSAALVPAAVAFLIGMGTVTGVELAAGKSLSCGVWDRCPVSADGTEVGTRPSLLGAGARATDPEQIQDQQQVADPVQEQQVPADPGAQPSQPATPQQDMPSEPATPVDPAVPAQEDPALQEQPAEDPAVEEAPSEQQVPAESPAESPVPAAPSDGSAQEPTPSEP